VDMMPEVYGGSSDGMLRRLLSRKGMTPPEMEAMLMQVEKRGGIYLPQVNAFYVREFQMAHAAEDAARFLHQACQGLPRRIDGLEIEANRKDANGNGVHERKNKRDIFYTQVIEHAVAYFGSRVLYPSPAPSMDETQLSRAACDKTAQAAARADQIKFDEASQDLGYRIGSEIYEAYLSGKVAPSSLRRLFLAHLDEPGLARKVCAAVISKLRSISRPLARAAHA